MPVHLSPTPLTALVSPAERGSVAPASTPTQEQVQIPAQAMVLEQAMLQGWMPFAVSGTDVCAQVKP